MKTIRILALTALVSSIAHAGIQDRIEYKQGRILAGLNTLNNQGAMAKQSPKKPKKAKRKSDRRAMMRK